MYIYAYTELHTYLTWEDLLKDNNFFLLEKRNSGHEFCLAFIYIFLGVFFTFVPST